MIKIKNSRVSWDSHTPLCSSFDDFYFNSDGGIAESHYVFVTPSNIVPKRATYSTLAIAETGFGTGLNLLTTLEALSTPSTQVTLLHYFSAELFPLQLSDFIRASQQWPQYRSITQQIIAQYPPPIYGFHRILIDNGRISLTLMLGDSSESFARCHTPFDAWYLDGFSPAKNPDMWTPGLFHQMARLSKSKLTTFSTFTSAGYVRRALQEFNFSINKQPGFGKKREMIFGTYQGENASEYVNQPWFATAKQHHTTPKSIAIIGAGLAGCTTAYALAQRGISVTIYESTDTLCSQASGNLQGALYAKLPVKPTAAGELHSTGLEFTLRTLVINDCLDKHTADQCGLLQLATTDKEKALHEQLITSELYPVEVVRAVTAQEASLIAGTHIEQPGLFYPRSGWVSPKRLCEVLIKSEHINLQLNTTVSSIQHLSNGGYSLNLADTSKSFDHVIICNATSAKQFEQTKHLPIKPIRGQVTHAAQVESIQPLKSVVCGAGYISPPLEGTYCFGASFNLHQINPELDQEDQSNNVAKTLNVLPQIEAQLHFPNKLTGKAASRCATADYLPIVGPAPNVDEFQTRYALLSRDKNWRFEPLAPPNYEGLYVNVGHGSKGLITCPLLAEHLACMITGEPSPLPSDLSNAVHPARFTVKQLIRRAI